jgi:hypothetical protein
MFRVVPGNTSEVASYGINILSTPAKAATTTAHAPEEVMTWRTTLAEGQYKSHKSSHKSLKSHNEEIASMDQMHNREEAIARNQITTEPSQL